MGQELQGSAGIAPGSKSFAVQFHVDFGIYCRIRSRIRYYVYTMLMTHRIRLVLLVLDNHVKDVGYAGKENDSRDTDSRNVMRKGTRV